jgi:hypothetical protein
VQEKVQERVAVKVPEQAASGHHAEEVVDRRESAGEEVPGATETAAQVAGLPAL